MALADPFSNLPPISFCNVDVAALQAAVVTGFQNAWYEATGETLNLTLADRRTNFLYSLVAYLVQERQLIDQSAKMNLLPYSLGGFLDALGIFFNTTRLPASPAVTTLAFTLDKSYAVTQVVPAGTTVQSAGSGLVFASDTDLAIAAGLLSGSVSATCTTAGPDGNGLLDINTVLNWPTNAAFTVTATNTSASLGGADTETDEAFRRRLLQATDSYSPAGPKGRYRYYAEAVSADISDVSVMGPEDGLAPDHVLVTVLLQNGQFPDATFINKVYNALNTDTVRDLCAQVTVAAPSGVPYSTSVRYWVDGSQSTNVVHIGQNVNTAVNAWISDNRNALGGSINPVTLSKAVIDNGASYCIVDQPAARIQLKLNQVGVLTDDPIVNFVGIEQDLQPA
jgi:phage-related baseplate assembly protein